MPFWTFFVNCKAAFLHEIEGELISDELPIPTSEPHYMLGL